MMAEMIYVLSDRFVARQSEDHALSHAERPRFFEIGVAGVREGLMRLRGEIVELLEKAFGFLETVTGAPCEIHVVLA